MRVPKNFSQKWNMVMISLLRFPFFFKPSSNIILDRSKTFTVFFTVIYTAKSHTQPSLETAALALQFNIRQVLCVPAGMNFGLFLTQPSFPAL